MDDIDTIIAIRGMTMREILRKYFPVNARYCVASFKPYKLRKLHEHGGILERSSLEFEIDSDITVEVVDIENGDYRWFVYTDEIGKKYGLAVMAMLELHRRGVIELEKI